ncbi:hypothetical protein BHAOGJBA_5153 [Methylobacterium hispanicum]|uniref:Uncharacterized protein n=1 Tax=Methylobacterium hispanicum TaxID=270350 RepID=A0AAV4ZVP3_9HYPH|nr:hypothetical protein [Methylobacterium hispanicum]GJD91605.1 hypothetical protein BHAOGJBA_5153 [Methylobacterium hispanicum]
MFGLGFFTRRRAHRATSAAMASLADAFAGQPHAERAAIMAVANALLASVAARHGDLVMRRPSTLDRDDAAAIVAELSLSMAKLSLASEELSGRDFGDPVLDGIHRQMRATELVVGTLGMAMDPSGKRVVVEAWSNLYAARRHARAAVAALLAFQEETGTSPFPEGVPSKPSDLLALATTAPPFLRVRTVAA